MRAHDVHGYIAMLMDLPSLAALRQLIQGFIAQMVGEDEAQAHG